MENLEILKNIELEMASGVLALNRKGQIVYANPFFMSAFSVDKNIKHKGVDSVLTDQVLIAPLKSFFNNGTELEKTYEVLERNRVFKVRPVKSSYESETSLLIFFDDVTEEKSAESIKKDFVANVSHELRTPLASIKGYSETLLDSPLDDKETLRKFLGIIDKHATRMSLLIDDLLILSKLESQRLPVNPVAMELEPFLEQMVHGFSRNAEGKNIKLSLDVADRTIKVYGDRDRLEQVMVNLIDNAIKYTPSGGDVIVRAYEDDTMIRVDVVDTGIGIPVEDVGRVFERFYRVDKGRSREMGGTGLGLAIVKHIIVGHNGKVWAESLGNGSVFSFTLMKVLY